MGQDSWQAVGAPDRKQRQPEGPQALLISGELGGRGASCASWVLRAVGGGACSAYLHTPLLRLNDASERREGLGPDGRRQLVEGRVQGRGCLRIGRARRGRARACT